MNISIMKKSSSDLTRLELLHANPWSLALHKEPGIPCQSRKSDELLPLDRSAPLYLNESIQLWTRIDQPVSGIVLFYREDCNTRRHLTRILNKTYLAIVEGHPPAAQTIKSQLVRDGKRNKARVDKTGKHAELFYRVISQFDRYSLIQVNPTTGRFHQIRQQLAQFGYPIKGDIKYGARRKNPDRSIHLHAFEYIIQKDSEQPITITDYFFPRDPLWSLSQPYILDWVKSENP